MASGWVRLLGDFNTHSLISSFLLLFLPSFLLPSPPPPPFSFTSSFSFRLLHPILTISPSPKPPPPPHASSAPPQTTIPSPSKSQIPKSLRWAYAGDSFVAIAAGQLAGLAALSRGPAGPFEISVVFLLAGALIAVANWKEVGGRNFHKTVS